MPAEILLIEDNRDHLELMGYLLRASGHKLMSVGCGEAAMGIAAYKKIDLVICDLMLGSMTGFDVAQFFKADDRLKHIPLVAVSALSAGSASPKALAAGFDGFIQKPIFPEGFVAEVQRLVKTDLTENVPPPAVAGNSLDPLNQLVPQHRGTILIVNDGDADLELTRCLLEELGFKVVRAEGLQEGLACARQTHPSLILTDVHIGGGSGFDLVKTVRTDPLLQHIPCLVTSATCLEADPRAIELGLDDSNFVLRPIDPGILLSKIEACLPGSSQGVPGRRE